MLYLIARLRSESVALTLLAESFREDSGYHTVEHDWKGLMRTLPDDGSETYTQALQLLDSLQNSPSCNRLAALTLLESCQKFDGSPPTSEEILEDIKSIYAARLALCEISITGLAVPSDCKPLMPAVDREGNSGLRWMNWSGKAKSAVFRDVGNRQLILCLRSLESRPQWWTSYSNSRQNAFTMCQAARVDIDRGNGFEYPLSNSKVDIMLDELIKLYKSMAQATSKLLDITTIKLFQQDELTVKIKGFHQRIFEIFDSSTLQFQLYFTNFTETTETAMQSMFGKWNTVIDELQKAIHDVRVPFIKWLHS